MEFIKALQKDGLKSSSYMKFSFLSRRHVCSIVIIVKNSISFVILTELVILLEFVILTELETKNKT